MYEDIPIPGIDKITFGSITYHRLMTKLKSEIIFLKTEKKCPIGS